MAGRRARQALYALCGFVGAVGLWNAARYPLGLGYDYIDHESYADNLISHGVLPHGVGEYYQPPGWYAIAGSVDWVAKQLGVGEPHRAALALDALFLVATVALVWKLVQSLWPERDVLALAACLFVALVPRVPVMAAMFEPVTLALLLSTTALWLCARYFRTGRGVLWLGLALGAAQLVMAATLWVVAAVFVALALGRRFRPLALVVVLAIVIPLPWYVHQQLTYSGLAPFPRPATRIVGPGQTTSGNPKPRWERRPTSFYLGTGLPDVFARPYRGHFVNRLWPTTYSELWGDYFGSWSWRATNVPGTHPPGGALAELRVQAAVGVLPTLLALAGWLLLLARSLRSPPRLAVALVPLFGLLTYLAFTVSYPTADGDVLKASYMLAAAGAWAVAFGYAVDRLPLRLRPAAVVLLAVCALADIPFLVYG